MSLSAAVVRELVAAGLHGDALIGACERIEAADAPEEKRSAGAIRQERYRLRKASQSVTSDVSDVTVTQKKEGFPHTPSEEKKSPPISPRDELAAVLDAEHASALLEHRQRIRKPLTARAAKLLASKLSSVADPNAAADLMIEKGWQSFEPAWASNLSLAPKVTSIRTDQDRSPEEMAKQWRGRLDLCRYSQQRWLTHAWGPMPGKPGCRVPPELLKPGDGEGWIEWKSTEAA